MKNEGVSHVLCEPLPTEHVHSPLWTAWPRGRLHVFGRPAVLGGPPSRSPPGSPSRETWKHSGLHSLLHNSKRANLSGVTVTFS